jgi:membrane-bound lytic murein transglycosylase A
VELVKKSMDAKRLAGLVAKPMFSLSQLGLLAGVLLLASCQSAAPLPPKKSAPKAPVSGTVVPEKTDTSSRQPPTQPYALLNAASWATIPGLENENWLASWSAWLQSCQGLKKKPDWQAVCTAAQTVKADDASAIQAYW